MVRTVNAAGKNWELVEEYTEEFASKKADNDCSFLVKGVISGSETDKYTFTCKGAQFVTVTLVPEHQLDIFNLRTTNPNVQSKESAYINWIQFNVPGTTTITAHVSLATSGQFLLSRSYRLIVTGSASTVAPARADIAGPHLSNVAVGAAAASFVDISSNQPATKTTKTTKAPKAPKAPKTSAAGKGTAATGAAAAAKNADRASKAAIIHEAAAAALAKSGKSASALAHRQAAAKLKAGKAKF